MGLGLLLPGLLLVLPTLSHADPKPTKPAARSATKSTAKSTTKTAVKSSTRPRPPAAPAACAYTVRSGDSVSRIAARHGVSRSAIVAANQLERPDALRVGRRLSIPGCQARREPRSDVARQAAPTDGVLLARVGPRRVRTPLHFGPPDLNGRAIDFAWPVMGPVASPFGRRRTGWHAGIDIKAPVGTPILAAATGRVLLSGTERYYGRVVKIEHANGFVTIYAHNLQNLVAFGDEVQAGTVIATVGRTGRSTAYHLHFEVRQDGMAYNPVHLLPERDTMVARADGSTDTEEEEDE